MLSVRVLVEHHRLRAGDWAQRTSCQENGFGCGTGLAERTARGKRGVDVAHLVGCVMHSGSGDLECLCITLLNS